MGLANVIIYIKSEMGVPMVFIKRYLPFLICIVFLLGACSDNTQEEKSVGSTGAQQSDTVASPETLSKNETKAPMNVEGGQTTSPNQKVIYTADLQLEVKDLKKANKLLEQAVKRVEGYIIQSNIYRDSDHSYRASLTIRVPQGSFEQFLDQAEGLAVKVEQRNVNGSDVSEEYVDLESRLKSKRAVESRLLDFMQKSTSTDDLLKISTDLATVQEQIEQITGRMKYLDNQIDYSTVTITLSENKITVPALEKTDLNTMEKIKKQFMTSINWILAMASGLAVLVIGNFPVLLIVGLIVGVVLFLIKRKKRD